jgi:hypothetical protein
LILDCENVENKELGIKLRNAILSGGRCFGNPAEGLKITMKQLESKLQEVDESLSKTDWKIKDTETLQQIYTIKAGIEGEEQLSEYLQTLLRFNKKLFPVFSFASLNIERDENLDYIPDTDFLLVCGNNLLVLDAKNLSTKKNDTLELFEGEILNAKGKSVLHLNGSTHHWKKLLPDIESIDGYVVIVNDTGAEILRNEEWETCDYKLIHVSELEKILEEWVDSISNHDAKLALLTKVAEQQIKKEHSNLDLDTFRTTFGV